MHIFMVYARYIGQGNTFATLLLKNLKHMNRIAVLITMHFDNSKGNFEELRQQEMAHIAHWKQDNLLDSFFIKSEKNGAMIIFKEVEMAEVVKKVEALPFFPYMEEVKYISFDKIM